MIDTVIETNSNFIIWAKSFLEVFVLGTHAWLVPENTLRHLMAAFGLPQHGWAVPYKKHRSMISSGRKKHFWQKQIR